MFPAGQIPPGILSANAIADFTNMDEVVLTKSVETNGFSSRMEIHFKDGHHCLAYDMIRTPNLSKAALEAVPAEAIAVASFALNHTDSARPKRSGPRFKMSPALTWDGRFSPTLSRSLFSPCPPKATPPMSNRQRSSPVAWVWPSRVATRADPAGSRHVAGNCRSVVVRRPAERQTRPIQDRHERQAGPHLLSGAGQWNYTPVAEPRSHECFRRRTQSPQIHLRFGAVEWRRQPARSDRQQAAPGECRRRHAVAPSADEIWNPERRTNRKGERQL